MDRDQLEANLYSVAANWFRSPSYGAELLVAAACGALVDGIDTPALVDLAGASGRENRSDLEPLVARMANDFDWDWPPPLEGLLPFRSYPRPGVLDVLDLDVRVYSSEVIGQVKGLAVLINGVDWAKRLGAGMPPTGMFAPVAVLSPTDTSHVTVVARCGVCGQPECVSASVRITRDGDVVVWEWVDGEDGDAITVVHQFAADDYARAIDRAASDHSWEDPTDTVERLVLCGNSGLPEGWGISFLADSRQTPAALDVHITMPAYFGYFTVPWNNQSPQSLAEEILQHLKANPQAWELRWMPARPGAPEPAWAGPLWRPYA